MFDSTLGQGLGVRTMSRPLRSRRRYRLSPLWAAAIAALFVALFPIVWMLLAAFKSDSELFLSPPPFLPLEPTLKGFEFVLSTPRYVRMLFNSYIIGLLVTGFSVVLASLAAYGFSRYDIPGKNSLLLLTLVLQMFPGVALLIPFYNIARSIGLYDTFGGLLMADASFVLPFCIWMMKSYLDTIPVELEEAAMVDGATRLGALVRVVMPLTGPGLIATATYAFLSTWNEYMFASILTRGTTFAPVTIAIGEFFGLFAVKWSEMAALATLASLPLMLLFIFFQRYLVEGMTAGAVK